ncbi:mitochondrial glycerol-3-phosphate dehydrogenase [Dimargaris xerosporica]|nr:mitochondrial glycerol-3-phosphate dehydrogenase [Dimargaris xerosporica]
MWNQWLLRNQRPAALATAAIGGLLGASYLYARGDDRSRRLRSWLTPAVYADAQVAPSTSASPPNGGRPSPFWKPPSRKEMLNMLQGKMREGEDSPAGGEVFDLLVIGGGATGAGVALDAATRGLRVAMVERDDFSAGTSSRSTKLVHGGVRYLEKAFWELDKEQYNLVKEALHERKTFLKIAPYLSIQLPIMIPVYKWWQLPYFWGGCKAYDFLAGKQGLESSYLLMRGKAVEAFPMLKKEHLKGALVYYDGQHNDSRMNVAIALTAISYGAVVANHAEVTSLIKEPEDGQEPVVRGAMVRDQLTGQEFPVRARGVINATGPFCDRILKMDSPRAQDIVAPSSGVHIILPKYYSPDNMGLIDPNTSDGRVIFFLPWQGHTIAGTTDSPTQISTNPVPQEEEIQWILDEVRGYLSPDIKVRRGDVLAAWSGIRPLVRDPNAKSTAGLVRSHMLYTSPSKLLTIAGGKWTTYRNMAEETVDLAIKEFNLKPRNGCVTTDTKLIGSHAYSENLFIKLIQSFGLETVVAHHLAADYGDRAWAVCTMAEPTGERFPIFGKRISPMHPYLVAEIRYAVKNEYACTIVDVLARRTRLAFVNAQAALESIPLVADVMGKDLGWDEATKHQQMRDAEEFLHAMGLPHGLELGKPFTSDSHQPSVLPSSVPAAIIPARTAADASEAEGKSSSFASYAPMFQAISMRYNQGQFHPEEIGHFLAAFNEYDRQSNGSIHRDDLMAVLSSLGLHMRKDQYDAMLDQFQLAKSNVIEFEDYLDIMGYIKESQYATAKPATFQRIPTHRSGGGV